MSNTSKAALVFLAILVAVYFVSKPRPVHPEFASRPKVNAAEAHAESAEYIANYRKHVEEQNAREAAAQVATVSTPALMPSPAIDSALSNPTPLPTAAPATTPHQ